MGSSQSRQIHEVFVEVAALLGQARKQALDELCGDDVSLRADVERLLEADQAAGGFMSRPTLAGLSTDVAMSTLPEGALQSVGPYTIVRRLGEGTFGDVYLATQEQPLRRTVALKIIKLGMDTRQVVARFVQESQALALMDHPHIARVFDAGATEAGRPYFVMELVDGMPLTHFADTHVLSIDSRLALIVQACQAVEHAHSKGVLHRDLKPSNVLASMRDGKPFAKVIDFGIAKATGAVGGMVAATAAFTDQRQFIGTPEYMSPEQAQGGPDVGPGSDVYSLGVLLYELLTGELPYPGNRLRSASYAEMQRIILEDDPPVPSLRLMAQGPNLAQTAAHRDAAPDSLVAAVRGDLDWIVLKALEKSAAQRYASALALADDIERHRQGANVLAAPPSTLYRLRRLIRRRRSAIAVASVVGVAVALGAAATVWQLIRAEAFSTEASAARTSTKAIEQVAESRRLAGLSSKAGLHQPQLRVLLAVESVRASGEGHSAAQPESIHALVDALDAIGGVPLTGHERAVLHCCFHPTGKLLATASADGTARLWTVTRGAAMALPTILRGHTAAVTCVDFSPDGSKLLTTSADGTARIWNMDDMSTEPLVLRGHRAAINFGQFSPDGSRVATAAQDNSARVWTLGSADPSESALELTGHGDQVRLARFSGDGKLLLTASYDGSARLWDAESGAALTDPLRTSVVTGWCRDAEFIPNRTYEVLALTSGAALTHWQVHGKQLDLAFNQPCSKEETDPVAIAVAPDGKTFATANALGTVSVLRCRNSEPPTLVHSLYMHTSEVTALEFSADGTRLLSASRDHAAIVWDLRTTNPAERPLVLRGHDMDVRHAALSKDGSMVVTVSSDCTARLWSLEGDGWAYWGPDLPVSPDRIVNSAALDRTGQQLAIANETKTVTTWTVDSAGHCLAVREFPGHLDAMYAVRFAPDGESLITLGKDRVLRIWSTDDTSSREPACLASFEPVFASGLCVHPSARIVTSEGDGNVCHVWDLDSPDRHAPAWTLLGHEGAVLSTSFSRDGKTLASGSEDGTAKVWRFVPGSPPELLRTFQGHRGYVTTVALSPDGSKLVTGSADRSIRLFDLDIETQDGGFVLASHDTWTTEVAFSDDGRTLLATWRGGRVQVWRLDNPRNPNLFLTLDLGMEIRRSSISADGERLLLVGRRDSVRLLDLNADRLIARAKHAIGRDMTQAEWQQAFPNRPYRPTWADRHVTHLID